MDDDTGVTRFEFSTTDPVEAERFFCGVYGEQRLTIAGRREDFTVTHSAVATADLSVTRVRTDLSLTHGVEGILDGVLAIAAPIDGHLAYLDNDYQDAYVGPGDVVLAPPTGSMSITSERYDLVMVTLDRSRVADYAAGMTGLDADELRFDAITPVNARWARQWKDTVTHVRENILAGPSVARQPLVLEQAFRSLAAAVLSTFPNTALARATDPDPAAMLRRARLRGARRDLLGADPEERPTIAELAVRWGFSSPGRFRDAYRDEFGELPDGPGRYR